MWLPRYKVFSQDNPYYKSKTFNVNLGSDLDLPNCTEYAVCRCYESSEVGKPFPIFDDRKSGYLHNAKEFFAHSLMPKGYDLKEGAIAVFDGNFGHVAFVEEVIDKNHAIISQSQYDSNKSLRNYKYFESRQVELTVGKATLSGIGKLIGFMYCPIHDIRVDRDETKEQIEIISDSDAVNVRIQPEGEIFSQGLYCPKGIFNVVDSKIVNEYTWYCLEENHWVREGSWLKHYSKAISDDELVKENAELKEQVAELQTELAVANNQLDEIRKIVC